MDQPPGSVTENRPQQAGENDRDHQVHRNYAEAQPKGPVGGGERDDGSVEAERGEGIDDGGDDVNPEEDEGHQCEVPMEGGRQETGPRLALPAHGGNDPEHPHGREQEEADRASAARRVPENRVAHAAASLGSGQGPRKCTVPSFSTRRAGSRRALSQSIAASAWTIAAVAAVLASRQLVASTVTVRQGPFVGSPLPGSMM